MIPDKSDAEGSAANYNPVRKAYKPITKVDLGVREITLAPGETYTFQIRYEPEEPYYYALNWFVTNDSVISLDEASGLVTAVAPGTTRILAESLDGMSYATCDVTVTGTVGKDAAVMKSGAELTVISDADRAKITAKSVLRFLDFTIESNFSESSYQEAADRLFMTAAQVVPGTEEAESRRALDLGMLKAQPLTELHMVNLYGTLAQTLAFTADNPDLLELFELMDSYLDDPVVYGWDDDLIGKAMNLQGSTEQVTSVSTVHNLGIKGDGYAIAVIDTGLNTSHEQFSGRIASQHCFSTTTGTTLGTDRYVSACRNGENEDSSAKPNSYIPKEFNHGSHVTGIAAGRDGIAPDAKIVAVLAFSEHIWVCTQGDKNDGYFWRVEDGKDMCYSVVTKWEDKLASYNWILGVQKAFKSSGKAPIAAVNMSYGGGIYSAICDSSGEDKEKAAYDEFLNAGIVPVVSSGNSYSGVGVGTPSCKSNAFRVGALADSFVPKIANYSNHSSMIHILAPGSSILSAFYTYEEDNSTNTCSTGGNCYGYYSGTSMAAPMVSGAFALLKQANPKMSPEDLENRLLEMSTKTVNTRSNGTSFSYSKPVLDFSQFKQAVSISLKKTNGEDVKSKSFYSSSKRVQLVAETLPDYASNGVNWTSSNTSIAIVTNGVVTFLKGGNVKITASTYDGSGLSAWTEILYTPPVESISLFDSSNKDVTGTTISLNDSSFQLKAEVSPSDALFAVNWLSDNSSVATVNNSGKVTFHKAGTVTIYAKASDDSGVSCWVKFTYAPLATAVTIENSSGTDITGKTVTTKDKANQLKAVAAPEGASQEFTWASSSTSISTVDENGKVTFKKAGSVKITATASDGSKKAASVTLKYVPLASSVTIQDSSGTDITGKTVTTKDKANQLKAVATPEGAAQEFTWASSSTSIATVDANGKVTFKKAGSVKITATASDGSKKAASVTLKYVPLVTSVTIQDSSGTDITGKTVTTKDKTNQLKAAAAPSGAAQKFTWTSSNTNIATVDGNGKVTFKKAGSVKITATASDGSKKAAFVTLKYVPLATSVTIQDPSGTDITGKTVTISSASYQLKAVAAPSGSAQKFTWTSSSTSIATIDSNGKVTFKKAGSVKITVSASDGSKKAASVTLKYIPLATTVTIQDSSGTDITGKTVTTKDKVNQLKAVAAPSGAAQKFTWVSSNKNIAIVDSNGKVSFKKDGSVKITAAASDGSKKSASVTLKYSSLATSVTIQDPNGTNITGKTVTVNTSTYQLKAVAAPSEAAQKFTWTSGSTGTATVDANGMVSFLKGGSVKITATTADGSKKSASVMLTFTPQKPVLEIKDTNIRGKNKEIQIVIPWSADLISVECTLYDDSTGKEVKPTFRERMDATGKNRVVSYVGSPLENGNVYRFKLRVYNGQWSNYVEKYAMPISNVYGATVVAGNKTMYINTQHREPATGTRYMVFDAATQKELAYKVGTKTDTTWKYDKLTNGKLYYVVAVPYRDYMEQRLWGPNENRIYFMPMGIPSNGKVSFSGTNATVSITADSLADGIRVLYRPYGGALKNGCEAKGTNCTISGLDRSSAYEFYAMKYKVAAGKTYYSTGTLIPYNGPSSGLSAPQMNPVVAMSNSGYTTFTIKKSSNAEGISVLYKIGNGNFQQACEKAGNSCATTLDTSKNYTFYIMQYRTMNGKKVYSPGIVARDYTSGKAPDAERLYYGFSFADESIDMNEIYDALDGYMGEDALLMAEAFAVMWEDLFPKDADEFEADAFYEDDDFDYSDFDTDDPYGEYDADDYDSWAPDEPVTEPYNEYADDSEPWEDLYEPNDESGNGSEEPVHEGSEPEEKELYMYRFDDDSPVLPPAPSFGNL